LTLKHTLLATSTALFAVAGSAQAEQQARYNMYGGPGLIDMPSAYDRPAAELAFSGVYLNNNNRTVASFQPFEGLFFGTRYVMRRFEFEGNTVESFDRSLLLHYNVLSETDWRPAISVGLVDLIGTSIFSSEYIVATKTFGENFEVTGGIGWGRLGGVGAFRNPLAILSNAFEEREERNFGLGGQPETKGLFQGDAALFGGVAWNATDRLTLLAEHSSDPYAGIDSLVLDRKSTLNYGLDYRLGDNADLGLAWMYGSELSARLTIKTNPRFPPAGAGREPAPPPVVPRSSIAQLGWTVTDGATQDRVASGLEAIDLELRALEIIGETARVDIINPTYGRTSQAIGRTARVLSATLPADITRFTITPIEKGVAGSAVTVARADLETLEYDPMAGPESLARSGFAPAQPLPPIAAAHPDFDWGIAPYIAPSLFDPDDPLRADAGVALSASVSPWSGGVISGRVRQKLIGNLDESDRPSTSVLPHVRSDANIYQREGTTALSTLTAAQYVQPAPEIYGRVTAGYLEPMFGGVSTELLWKPQDSRLALGAEANYVVQRDYDQAFGFQDYEVATGHVSAYYDIGGGYRGQIDMGRYLAGDWGATFTLDREFENGWSLGAFATLTDVPFDDFGEGSFDKGLRLTIPIDWVRGEPTRDDFSTVIRPVTRDGGARLKVEGRLYETVREMHQPELGDSWGRFWK
jgi:hypothetical protein